MEEWSREELLRQLEENETKLHQAAVFGKQLLENNQAQAEKYEVDVEECNKRIEHHPHPILPNYHCEHTWEELSKEELLGQLEENETKLHQTAVFGKQLLEDNQAQAEKYEVDVEEGNKKIESLEQEKYGLQMHLESKDHMEKHYETELSNTSDRSKREVAAVTERLQMAHAKELQKYKSTNDSLKEDLDLHKLRESQLQEKVKSLEERLGSVDSAHNRTFTNLTATMEEQVATLAEQLSRLRTEKVIWADSLKEREEVCKQQAMTISSSTRRLEDLEEQIDDQHKQCVSFQRALEECRERLEETQAEVELLKLESQDPNRKGNSLFAEVDVKRREIEKKYISLTVQHDAMKKRANFHKHRVQELKLQVANLLLIDDSRVSASRVRDLQKDLVRARQQVQQLMKKLSELEENRTVQPAAEKTTEGGLAYLLEQEKKEREKLRKELQHERMMHVASETKEIEYERRLHDTTTELDRCRAQLIKMELKNSDLKEKLKVKGQQPGEQPRETQSTQGRLEKIPTAHLPRTDTGPTSVNENKENVQDASVPMDMKANLDPSPKVSTTTNIGGEIVGVNVGDTDAQGERVGEEGETRSILEEIREVPENKNSENAGRPDGSSRKRENGSMRGKQGMTGSNGRGRAVTISDQVEVIGLEDSVDQSSLQEGDGQEDTVAPPSKPKKTRSKAPIVHVRKGEQNECKQQ